MDIPSKPPLQFRVYLNSAPQSIAPNFHALVDFIDLLPKSCVNGFYHDFLVLFLEIFFHGGRSAVDVTPDRLLLSVKLPVEINVEHGLQMLWVNSHETFFLHYLSLCVLLLNVVQHESMDGLMKWGVLKLRVMQKIGV